MALFNQSYVNIGSQFGMPLFGVAGVPPFTGNYFWVDQTNGSDGNTGGPQDPFATLSQAHSACLAGNNDVVFFSGTISLTATLSWTKAKTHLIGLAPASNNGRARISQTGSTVFTPLVSVTAQGCIFQNFATFHGFANASAQICWADTGGRNGYTNVQFFGMGATLAANEAGSRSLTIGGEGENLFTGCTIGLDTITRSAANASLEFLSGPRNVFRNCIFPMMTDDATAVCVTAGAAASDRYQLFDNCAFINAIDSTSTTATAAFTINAAAGGLVLINGGAAIGFTNISASGPVYVQGAVPTGNTSLIAVAAS